MNGLWWVWNDSSDALLEDVDYVTMKTYVDEGHANGQLDLYGENMETGNFYEGEE